jgi:hypothetical protein
MTFKATASPLGEVALTELFEQSVARHGLHLGSPRCLKGTHPAQGLQPFDSPFEFGEKVWAVAA